MEKFLNWIKKIIFDKKQVEKAEQRENKKVEIKENKRNILVGEEKIKEKIYINHMDDLFWEAGRFVIEKDKAFIGMLQSHFKIEFNRAARIMDELCEAGVVGEEAGEETRKILMSYDEFDKLWMYDGIKEGGKLQEYMDLEKKENINENSLGYIYPPLSLLRKYIEPIKAEGNFVPFREIIESKELKNSSNHLLFAVGRDFERKEIISNVLDFPQIVITDNTGSKKAAFLNSMIMSFIYKTHPNDVKMILIDTSNKIFDIYNGIPQLLIPVVTDIKKTIATLKWVISVCDNREKKLNKLRVSNINEYNMSEDIRQKMPFILVFINEFTDLILNYGTQIEEIVDNITQLAEKTGIYPIIAEKKLNCSHCIISVGKNIKYGKKFIVVPSMDLMRKDGKEIFIQGAYLSEDEIFGVVFFIRRQYENQTGKIVEAKEKILDKLSRIDMYNNKIDYMTGEDFEQYVAQNIGNIGFYNIQLTKGSGDQGVDILAEKDGIKYAFQCKRYDKPVGNKAVQEVYAGKTFYHCHVGIVVTNNYFTQSAKDLAKANGIVLWDKEFLNEHIWDKNFELNKGSKSNNSFRILDAEERIVAIEDEEGSKELYQYLESASRNFVDMYLKNGDENPYSKDMIENVERPLFLYNAKCLKLSKYILYFTYWCRMSPNFKNTPAYRKTFEMYKENEKKYKHDLFNISVYYNVEDIFWENKKIKINNIPEVNIISNDMETIKLLEDIDEYDIQTGNKFIVTEKFFPMKIDNIKN